MQHIILYSETILDIFEHIYSKVLKSSETYIFNIQLVQIYKTIYIL
jgi:hypothetical protein